MICPNPLGLVNVVFIVNLVFSVHVIVVFLVTVVFSVNDLPFPTTILEKQVTPNGKW